MNSHWLAPGQNLPEGARPRLHANAARGSADGPASGRNSRMPMIPKIVWRGKPPVVPIGFSKAYCIVDCLGNSPLFQDRLKVRLEEVHKKDHFPGVAYILMMGPPVPPPANLPFPKMIDGRSTGRSSVLAIFLFQHMTWDIGGCGCALAFRCKTLGLILLTSWLSQNHWLSSTFIYL